MERLAADFSANPEQILPEAGALETGRSYREKKAKPLLAKIVKVLWALYLAYVELKGKFERLQTDYGQVQKANSRLSERLQEVKLENKSLRRTSADYAQLKQILGAEQIEATLNAAKRLKQSEKGCTTFVGDASQGVEDFPTYLWYIYFWRNMITARIKSQS